MKIGLISINMYSLSLNFACPLHTFAFQSFLAKKGIDSVVIDYKPNYYDNFDQKNPADYYDMKLKNYQKKLAEIQETSDESKIEKIKDRIAFHSFQKECYEKLKKEREIRYEKFREFIDKNYKKTKKTYDAISLEVEDPGFDCYICVSDAIWKKEPGWGYDAPFFLASTCMDDKWKIAYAASTLMADEENDKNKVAEWIRDMDFVSVREDILQKRLQKNIRLDTAWVLDPTMLHDHLFYESFLVAPKEKGYVLLYYVMEPDSYIIDKALEYAQAYNLKMVELSDKPFQNEKTRKSGQNVIFRYDLGIEEWLGYIKYAECVFTNSFHACCFSVLFEKPLFAQHRRYDKVGSLLNSIGLSDRIIEKDDQDYYDKEPIDWDLVRSYLEKRRKESEYFILNAIAISEKVTHPKRKNEYKTKQTFPLLYNIPKTIMPKDDYIKEKCIIDAGPGRIKNNPNSIEFISEESQVVTNDGTCVLSENMFNIGKDYIFKGWKLRLSMGGKNLVLLSTGKFIKQSDFDEKKGMRLKVFRPGEKIPVLDVNGIKALIAVSVCVKIG